MVTGRTNLSFRDTLRIQRLSMRIASMSPEEGEARRYLATSIKRMLDAAIVSVVVTESSVPGGPSPIVYDVHVGPTDRMAEDRWRSSAEYDDTRLNPLGRAMSKITRPVFACRRRDLLDDDTWSSSETYRSLSALGIGDTVIARSPLPWTGALSVAAHRYADRGDFGRWHVQMLRSVMASLRRVHRLFEVGPKRLSNVHEGLSRREGEVLELLIAGHSVKDAARRLGIGDQTVAGHIKAIYKCFGVHSRAELLAKFIK